MQMKIVAALLGCLLLALGPATGLAEMQPRHKIRVGTPPYDILATVLAANQKQRAELAEERRVTPAGAPLLTWLADSDPRLQPDTILPKFRSTVFTVRNLGPELKPVLRSVDHGVRELHTPVLLITSIIAPTEVAEQASRWQPAAPPAEGNRPAAPASQQRQKLEQQVDELVELALARYRDRVDNGRLLVVGSLLDLADSYGAGHGSLIIINLNGEKEAKRLRQHRAAAKLDRELRRLLGRGQRP